MLSSDQLSQYLRVCARKNEQYYSWSSSGNVALWSTVFVVLPAMFWNLQIAVDFFCFHVEMHTLVSIFPLYCLFQSSQEIYLWGSPLSTRLHKHNASGFSSVSLQDSFTITLFCAFCQIFASHNKIYAENNTSYKDIFKVKPGLKIKLWTSKFIMLNTRVKAFFSLFLPFLTHQKLPPCLREHICI